MNVLISTWVLVMTSSVVVLGASVGGVSSVSVFGLRLPDDTNIGHLLQRHTRSFDPADITCVSIPRLVEIQEKFRGMVDHNADGRATPQEVKTFFQSFKDVTDNTVAAFIARRDLNNNGVLDFVPDYVQSLTSRENTLEDAKEWFFLHDTNNDGFVTGDELLQIGKNLGMSPGFEGYYMAFDNNNDGKLSFDEFKLLYA